MKRVASLDGIRGLAILMVLVWHFIACLLDSARTSPTFYLVRALSQTRTGVDLFFVLSGFLIAGILLDHRRTANYFRVFYLRRVCRIFPLYFLMLGLFALFLAVPFSSAAYPWLFHHPFPLWSYALFVQNFFMAVRGNFGPFWLGMTWSLAVEEQFYLFVPLLIYFLPRRTLVLVLVLAILAAPLLRCATGGFGAFVLTPWRSDSLLSGALLAVLVRWPPFLRVVRENSLFILALFLALIAGAALITLRPAPFGGFEQLWLAALYAVFILMAFAGTSPRLDSLLATPSLLWLGKVSYGLYMYHQAINGLVHGWLRHAVPAIRTPSDAAVTLLALILSCLLAEASFRFFESPLIRWGHRFRYQPAPVSLSPN